MLRHTYGLAVGLILLLVQPVIVRAQDTRAESGGIGSLTRQIDRIKQSLWGNGANDSNRSNNSQQPSRMAPGSSRNSSTAGAANQGTSRSDSSPGRFGFRSQPALRNTDSSAQGSSQRTAASDGDPIRTARRTSPTPRETSSSRRSRVEPPTIASSRTSQPTTASSRQANSSGGPVARTAERSSTSARQNPGGSTQRSVQAPVSSGQAQSSAGADSNYDSIEQRMAAARSSRRRQPSPSVSSPERESKPVERVARAEQRPTTESATSGRRPITNRNASSDSKSTGDAGAPRVASSRTAQPSSGAAGSNTATNVTANQPAVNNDPDVLFTRKSPVLGIQTVGPRSVRVGHAARYQVVMQNSGNLAAEDVVVRVNVPVWAEVTGSEATKGTARSISPREEDGGIDWSMNRLDANSKETLTIEIVPRENKPFDLGVQWTHSPVASQTMVEVQEPQLKLQISGPTELLYGQSRIYRLTVSNPGSGDADNVELTLLPTGEDTGNATESQSIGTLAAGQSKVLELEVVPNEAGKLIIGAEAVADGDLRAADRQEVTVRRAELKVAVMAPTAQYAGATVVYRMVVTNPGNAPAENIEVKAAIPAGAKVVELGNQGRQPTGSDTVRWNIASLPANESREIQWKLAFETPSQIRLKVAATADGELDDSTIAQTDILGLSDLVLEVSDPAGPVSVGDEVTYEIRLRNRGTQQAENIELNAFFTEGIEPIEAHGARSRISPGQVSFATLKALAAGEVITFNVKARAGQAGVHICRVQLHCEAEGISVVEEESTRFLEPAESLSGRRAQETHTEPMPLRDTGSFNQGGSSDQSGSFDQGPSSDAAGQGAADPFSRRTEEDP